MRPGQGFCPGPPPSRWREGWLLFRGAQRQAQGGDPLDRARRWGELLSQGRLGLIGPASDPSPCRSLGDAATCWPHAGHAAPSSPSGPSPSSPSPFLPSPLLPSPSPGSESFHCLSPSEQPRSPHHAQAREPPRSGAGLSTAGLSTVGRPSHRWRAVVSCEAALVASIRHALLPWGVADIRGPPRPTMSQGHSAPSPTLTWALSRS